MNKWVKQKWLRALRSGEYGKGKHRLGHPLDNEYCCLGVLGIEMVPEFCKTSEFDINKLSLDSDSSYLPDDLAILWELSKDTQRVLSCLNDSAETFAPVIAYIEENL